MWHLINIKHKLVLTSDISVEKKHTDHIKATFKSSKNNNNQLGSFPSPSVYVYCSKKKGQCIRLYNTVAALMCLEFRSFQQFKSTNPFLRRGSCVSPTQQLKADAVSTGPQRPSRVLKQHNAQCSVDEAPSERESPNMSTAAPAELQQWAAVQLTAAAVVQT